MARCTLRAWRPSATAVIVSGALGLATILGLSGCVKPVTTPGDPPVSEQPEGVATPKAEAGRVTGPQAAGGGATHNAAPGAGNGGQTQRWIAECAKFRVNTEDQTGSVPDACRRLVKGADEVVSLCGRTQDPATCYVAGLITVGNVPTTVAFSLRLPKREGFARETIQLQERIANPSLSRGASMVDKACDAGNQNACELQTMAKLPGYDQGFTRNVLANLCMEASSPGACAWWAYDVTGSRMKSEDDPQVLANAREVLAAACREGGSRSCANLAVVELMFDDYSPVASQWAAEGCVLGAGDPRLDGRAIACANLVSMRLFRKPFKRLKTDWSIARNVLAEACGKGDQSACAFHAHARLTGLGGKRDRRAKGELKGLCRQGVRDACR